MESISLPETGLFGGFRDYLVNERGIENIQNGNNFAEQ